MRDDYNFNIKMGKKTCVFVVDMRVKQEIFRMPVFADDSLFDVEQRLLKKHPLKSIKAKAQFTSKLIAELTKILQKNNVDDQVKDKIRSLVYSQSKTVSIINAIQPPIAPHEPKKQLTHSPKPQKQTHSSQCRKQNDSPQRKVFEKTVRTAKTDNNATICHMLQDSQAQFPSLKKTYDYNQDRNPMSDPNRQTKHLADPQQQTFQYDVLPFSKLRSSSQENIYPSRLKNTFIDFYKQKHFNQPKTQCQIYHSQSQLLVSKRECKQRTFRDLSQNNNQYNSYQRQRKQSERKQDFNVYQLKKEESYRYNTQENTYRIQEKAYRDNNRTLAQTNDYQRARQKQSFKYQMEGFLSNDANYHRNRIQIKQIDQYNERGNLSHLKNNYSIKKYSYLKQE